MMDFNNVNVKDLRNPREAAKLIESFRKRFQKAGCMGPDLGHCEGHIVSAHTLSAEGMLRPISRDGHVYAPDANLYASNKEGVIHFRRKGIRETSVFNGFCSYHDRELFKEIETKPFVCSRKQVFLHAYRAVAKESFLKRSQFDTIPTPEILSKIHGISVSQTQPDLEFYIYQMGVAIGADEIERFKKKLDLILLNEDWSRLITWVIQFNKIPSLVCNSVYSPDYDYAGNLLQDHENWEIDLEKLMVTIIPSELGGFALFSFLDTSTSVCEKMIRSILSQPHLTTAIMWFAVGQFENIAFSPFWYESLSDYSKVKLRDHFRFTADAFNHESSQLHMCPDYLDDWEAKQVFQI